MNEVAWCEQKLAAALPGGDADLVVELGRFVEVGRKRLFHADGAASAADIARCGQQILDVDQLDLFVRGQRAS